MKILKKLSSVILGVCLVVCIMPMGASAMPRPVVSFGKTILESEQYYSVSGGVSDTKPDGDSYAYYKYGADESSLTLHNFEFKGSGENGENEETAFIANTDIVVNLEGTNKIECPANNNGDTYGMYVEGALKFTGDGKLTVISGNASNESDFVESCAISSYSLNIEDAQIIATSGNATSSKDCESIAVELDEGFTMSSGLLQATSGKVKGGDSCYSRGIDTFNNFTMKSGTIIVNAGDVEATGYNCYSYGINVEHNCSISGGTITAISGKNDSQFGDTIGINTTDLNITGGTIFTKSGIAVSSDSNSYGVALDDLNISDGKLIAKSSKSGAKSNAVNVYDSSVHPQNQIMHIDGGCIFAQSSSESGSNMAFSKVPEFKNNWYQWKTDETKAFTSSKTAEFPDEYETISFANIIPLTSDYSQTLENTDATFTKGSGKDLNLDIDDSSLALLSMTIDGVTVPDKAVSFNDINDNKTQMILNNSYLENLTVGNHAVKFVFTDKEITGQFTVAEKAVPQDDTTDDSKTSDTTDTTDTTKTTDNADTTETIKATETTKNTSISNPKTSDNSSLIIVISLLFIAVCGLFTAKVTKKNK